MRILLICALDVWSLDQGKGAPTLERTLRAYGEAGHQVDAVLPDIGANHFYRRGARADNAETRPQIANVRFHTFHMPSVRDLPLPALPEQALAIDQKLRYALAFPWLAAKHAESLIRDASPPHDVLYAYEVHAALAARLLRRRGYRLPLVTRFQGTVMHPALSDRMLYYRRYEEVLALKTRSDLLIMTDDGTRGDDVIARINPAMKPRMKFWRNGLDLDRLQPPSEMQRHEARALLSIPPSAFVMLTASRLAAWKRVDRAIRALPAVRAWLPDALLLVVGDGEERARLEALARELAVAGDVALPGFAPNPFAWMSRASVFVLSSAWEGFSNVLAEALACGCPVVSTDCPSGPAEILEYGRHGALVPVADAGALADAILATLEKPSDPERLRARAASFSVDTAVDRYLEVLVGSHAAARA
jgi:glycosyltransferase involved in cell wall biosynthesis